jgi:hypothetical protein
VPLRSLIIAQLIIEFRAFCRIACFIAVTTRPPHADLRTSFLVHTLQIVPPSTPRSSKWSLTFRFFDKSLVFLYPVFHTYYTLSCSCVRWLRRPVPDISNWVSGSIADHSVWGLLWSKRLWDRGFSSSRSFSPSQQQHSTNASC